MTSDGFLFYQKQFLLHALQSVTAQTLLLTLQGLPLHLQRSFHHVSELQTHSEDVFQKPQ
jgi:hypothetical protein